MKLFKISQNVHNDYDTYSDAIVCAKDENDARRIHPSQKDNFKGIFYEGVFKNKRTDGSVYVFEDEYGSWTNNISKVKVEYIGKAKKGLKKGVICASFHAG